MSHRRAPAVFRAVTASAFTGTLAVAAHAVAGGGWPAGGAAALLAAVALAVGLIAATEQAAGTPALVAVLAAGQSAAHFSLAAGGHVHETSSLPTSLMVSAHVVAVLIGAILVAGCERLAAALSQAVRRCAHLVHTPPDTRGAAAAPHGGQPLQHVLLLAASISHRGPPARVRL